MRGSKKKKKNTKRRLDELGVSGRGRVKVRARERKENVRVQC